MNSVQVTTGSRLHFGLICTRPTSAHRFGGLGLMLQEPCWKITATASDSFDCDTETDEIRKRVHGLMPRIAQLTGLHGLHVSVDAELPLHQGLGAGTQLALAVATAALIVAGQPRPPSSAKLATDLNRMRRSAAGTLGFDRGGLIVDDGLPSDSSDRLLCSHEFPSEWRTVLIAPKGEQGLSGTKEESLFRQDHWMTDSIAAEQIKLIRETLVPAVQQSNFEVFRDGLARYGRIAGTFFSAQQGGVYSSERIRRLATIPELSDLQPVQSSWGPTVAVLARSNDHATEITSRIIDSAEGTHLSCRTTGPLNIGATVRTIAPEQSDHVARG
jgi:beta-ribofuranosylaminobenzene 5'-phosphate synthase